MSSRSSMFSSRPNSSSFSGRLSIICCWASPAALWAAAAAAASAPPLQQHNRAEAEAHAYTTCTDHHHSVSQTKKSRNDALHVHDTVAYTRTQAVSLLNVVKSTRLYSGQCMEVKACMRCFPAMIQTLLHPTTATTSRLEVCLDSLACSSSNH